MRIDIKNQPKGVVEIEFEVTAEEMKPYLEDAAKQLSKEKPVEGFRPGFATLDAAKAKFGEMAVYEDSLPTLIRKAYVKAVKENDLRTFGEPKVEMKKLAPGNPVVFTCTVTLVPKVTKLADWKKIRVKSEPKQVKDDDVAKSLKELQKMRTTEAAVDREVKAGDKVVIDMDMSLAGVPLEGGAARDHGIYLDEDYYIPGLKDQLVGMKAAETRKFPLKFPETHYQKNIAGKEVDFSVTVKQVFELGHPELNDEFAKGLGQSSLQVLKDLLKKNMEEETSAEAKREAENKAVEKIVEACRYEDIPEEIVNREVNRMLHELEHGLEHRGVKFEDYLQNLKKTVGDLKLEMAPQAIRRVKAALAIDSIGDAEAIEVSDAELLAEQQRLVNEYGHDAAAQERVRSEEYQDYLRTALRNNKIVDIIRKTCVE
jgi:trigger factor